MEKYKLERRQFLKKSGVIASAGAMIGISSCNNNEAPPPKTTPAIKVDNYKVGHGDFVYEVDKLWGVQDPLKIPVDHCHEMVMDSKGRLIMCTTNIKNNILMYDKSGKIINSWGIDYPGAHGLTLSDEGGEEFLYLTDTIKHQVYKLTMDGRRIMTFDYPKEVGVYETADQYQPTETAVASNGDIYITDGYGQNIITQYDSKGKYIRHFGGKGDGQDQFQTAHGICIDSRGAEPELLITSRSKQEFKRFTMDGEHIETIALPGCSICRPVIRGENLYFAVIVTKSWWDYDGMVAVLDKNNKVVSLPGGSMPTYVNGVLEEPEFDGKTFLNPHDVCIDDEDNIYVPQWYSGKTYPIKLKRV